ncbi:PD-(D/E)XK motif protein [Pseudomonas japonica]|uniref:PD-(D/E)XK motif protein n=1 Tax=Pseudomonas japonica TaxID=256466 RepID=UPI0015E3090D|nr:PD-(D/E)XK motif protein [Pseudomonas japonica]MBA1290991.1 PD-(D/E)XK motif protein [Pseudomonas japonica]
MSDLLKEIQEGFANLDQSGRMLPIKAMPATCPAWVFREEGRFGVAIECSERLKIAEGFAGANLRTVERLVAGKHRCFLRLESSMAWLRNEFGVICAHMVGVGCGIAARESLLADPLAWWQRWRHLLGNALVDKRGYDVLAELLSLEALVIKGAAFEWSGPFGGVVDIRTLATDYEVKSTVSRYGAVISVSGQFQLAASSGKALELIHCRFEPVNDGLSIDLVCDRLVALGVDAAMLERSLQRLGMEAGCSARKEAYNLLEARSYPVDDNFPRITPASFIGGALPAGVVQFEYQVDLSGLNSYQL